MALPVVEATTAEELDIAFASAAAQHADAISVFGDALTVNNASRVTALAAKHRLPASYLFRLFATIGGLMSYGPDLADLFIRAGGSSIRSSRAKSRLTYPSRCRQSSNSSLIVRLRMRSASPCLPR